MDVDFNISNASPEDFGEINTLFKSPRAAYFGATISKYTNSEEFFSKYVTHRMVVRLNTNHFQKIVGYAEISNFPNIPALPEDCWLDWLNFHYCTKLTLTVTNTYFFNTYIFAKAYNPEMMKRIVEEFFFREFRINYLITVQCPDYRFKDVRPNYTCLEAIAQIFHPRCFSAISCANTECIHIIQRQDVIPIMRYRKALPEDNDDVVEMLDVDRPELRMTLGDFYIAEELLLDDSPSVLVVTELKNSTAGFVWLNGNVNVTTLMQNFHIETFDNLIKYNPNEPHRQKFFTLSVARRTPAEDLFTSEAIHAMFEDTFLDSSSNERMRDTESEVSFNEHDSLMTMKKEAFETREKFFTKCEILNTNLQKSKYYIKIKNVLGSVPYNVCEGYETFSFDDNLNAFAIQLFGLSDAYDARRIIGFLSTSFVAFPDRDYCLLSMSVAMRMTPALFEILKYMIRVTPRPVGKIDEYLFLTHRCALYGDLSLTIATSNDTANIMKLLSTNKSHAVPAAHASNTNIEVSNKMSLESFIEQSSKHSLDFNTCKDFEIKIVKAILNSIFNDPSSDFKCYTIRCGDSTRPLSENTIVGFAIIRPFHLSHILQKHFILQANTEGNHQNKAELVMLKLHPFFHYQADVIFRELARQSNTWYFYYFKPLKKPHLSNDLIMNMQPLEPRRTKKIWFRRFNTPSQTKTKQEHSKNQNNILDNISMNYSKDHYALHCHNLCPSFIYGITTNLVIIGFGDICKATLRLLIFSWYSNSKSQAKMNCLSRLNISVITEPGVVEAEFNWNFKCKFCKHQSDCWINYYNTDAFLRDTIDRLDIRAWVRFINSEIDFIDPDKKVIRMKSFCEIFYETLIFMCGTDYGPPDAILNYYGEYLPRNYCQINNRFNKIMLYHKLCALQEEMPETEKKAIIVYGDHVRVYEFINFLLKHGVKADEITLVIPYDPKLEEMRLKFNKATVDIRIENILREMIDDLNILVYDKMNLEFLETYINRDILRMVTFKSFGGETTITLNCDLFVSFRERDIPNRMLNILDDMDVAIENSLVLVNNNFRTSIEHVYAIGNFIKFKKEPNHQYKFVNALESAEKLIVALELNNTPMEMEEKYSKPIYFQAHLPMNYYMAKIVVPKRYLAFHLDNQYDYSMTTYAKKDFCRVRLNTHNMVEEIVVVTQKRMDFDFLKYFVGRHELLLNNLRSRWYLHDIENFLTFFQEPWVELLMHDNFDDLHKSNINLIRPTAEEIMQLNVDRYQRHKVMINYGLEKGITTALEEAFLQFIRDHREDFYTDIALPEDFPNTI